MVGPRGGQHAGFGCESGRIFVLHGRQVTCLGMGAIERAFRHAVVLAFYSFEFFEWRHELGRFLLGKQFVDVHTLPH
jgi:hypothetical protein